MSEDIVFISVDPTPVVLETSIGSEPPILDVYVNRGETGATGPVGPAGPIGLTGPAGADGVDGVDGTNGVSYTSGDPIYVTVRNASGSLMNKGTIVYTSGANGTHTQVSKALATSDATSARVLGWLANDLPNNTDGLCMVEGYLDGIDTQGIGEGSQLYLSGNVAGGFTAIKPQAPIHLVYVGVATKISAGNGRVYVKVQNGYELDEIHDVQITTPADNQVLTFESSTGLWKNKTNPADGVTSITASSPLTGGTITATGSIGLDQTALSITQSQVADLVSDLAGKASTTDLTTGLALKANLAGGNALTGAQTITSTAIGQVPLTLVGASGQTANLLSTAGGARIPAAGNYFIAPGIQATYVMSVNAGDSGTVPLTVTGAAGQIANLINAGGLKVERGGALDVSPTAAVNGYSQIIRAATASVIPVMVRGAASQSVDLQQWQNSAGTRLASVDNAGRGIFATVLAGALTSSIGVQMAVQPTAATTPGFAVRGAASQSASLTQWQNSAGTVLAGVSASGRIFTGTAPLSNAGGQAANISVLSDATTVTPLIVRSIASQTANLQEWQDSASNPVAWVSSAGTFVSSQSTGFSIIGAASFGSLNAGQTVRLQAGSGVAANAQVVVRGVSGATGNLQEWQDSASAVKGYIDRFGDMSIGSLGLGFVTPYSSYGNSLLSINTVGAGNKGIVVRAVASPTADLQQWQDSAGNNNVSISPTFGLVGRNAGNLSYAISSGAGLAAFYSQATTNVLMTLRGASGQTANLQEWQDSSGNVLAHITSGGGMNLNSRLLAIANSAASVPIISRGVASQTGNLQEWQNSAGSVLAQVTSNGNLITSGQVRATESGIFGDVNQIANTRLSVYTRGVANRGMVIQGTASQTANLQEWQNSAGTVLASVNSAGDFQGPLTGFSFASFGATRSYVDNVALRVYANNSGAQGAIIRGAASQTANLQEWQNSAGTIRARVDNDGNFFALNVGGINQLVFLRENNSGGGLEMRSQTAVAPNPGNGRGTLYFRDGTNAGTLKLVVRAGAAGAETTILDNIPQ